MRRSPRSARSGMRTRAVPEGGTGTRLRAGDLPGGGRGVFPDRSGPQRAGRREAASRPGSGCRPGGDRRPAGVRHPEPDRQERIAPAARVRSSRRWRTLGGSRPALTGTKEGGGLPIGPRRSSRSIRRWGGAAGQPVLSVDPKKEERIGNVRGGGRPRRPREGSDEVRVRGFPDPDRRRARPPGARYRGSGGIHDLGWVWVGICRDPAAFAVGRLGRGWCRRVPERVPPGSAAADPDRRRGIRRPPGGGPDGGTSDARPRPSGSGSTPVSCQPVPGFGAAAKGAGTVRRGAGGGLRSGAARPRPSASFLPRRVPLLPAASNEFPGSRPTLAVLGPRGVGGAVPGWRGSGCRVAGPGVRGFGGTVRVRGSPLGSREGHRAVRRTARLRFRAAVHGAGGSPSGLL